MNCNPTQDGQNLQSFHAKEKSLAHLSSNSKVFSGIANFSNNFIDANSRKPSRINSSNLAKENDQNRATEHGMYQKKEAEDPSQTQEPNEKLFQKKKSKRVAKSRRSKRTKTIRGVDIPKGQFYHNPTSGPMGLAENMDFRKQKGLSRQATFDSKNSKEKKISTITNNGECNGKELRIEGLMATQNSLSTKNSIVNRPLKIRNSGVKSEISENSDTGITLKSNIIHQPSFKNGNMKSTNQLCEAQILQSQLQGSEISDDTIEGIAINPTRVKRRLPKSPKANNASIPSSHITKIRSNSSNAIPSRPVSDQEVSSVASQEGPIIPSENRKNYGTKTRRTGFNKNYHSAQRSTKSSGHGHYRMSDSSGFLKAMKLNKNDKRMGHFSHNQRANTQGIHLLPSTNKFYRNTKRIDFSRRMHMMDRPLLIITFEGIIGVFHKENLWKDKNFKMITRSGSGPGLKLFCNYFQVVIFIKKNLRKNTVKIKEWLKAKKVPVDGIYGKREEGSEISEDYAQIYNDFMPRAGCNLDDSKKIAKGIILLNSVDHDSLNISSNHMLEKLIFKGSQKEGYSNNNAGAIASGFPYTISCNSTVKNESISNNDIHQKPKSMLDMPLTILFPHLLTEKAQEISMTTIFRVIISIAFLSLKKDSKVRGNYDKRVSSECTESFQREFCGFDLTNLCESHQSNNFFIKGERGGSSTHVSDSDTKVTRQKVKQSDSFNYSFEVTNSVKVNSSDDETSGPDSCSSVQTLGHEKPQFSDVPRKGMHGISSSQNLRMKQAKNAPFKSLNESHLSKVNWIIGFEEASARKIYDCLWINTEKINAIVKRKYKELIQIYTLKAQRDKKIKQMVPKNGMTSELYFKKKNNQISTVVSCILKDAGIIGNPIQSMMARNIRHFENISYLDFQKEGELKKSEKIKLTKEQEEREKAEKEYKEAKSILAQASRYKRVNNFILAFGFSENASLQTRSMLFTKTENEKEELENDEDFDLIKWFFGAKNTQS
ncbi:unnamed protein product [Moneuplotes crassus]|uniref:Uncharacterized protein n=2 Tax=Euplotes crassus TaxID=5936 RepID=A0AAD1X858_EUPCR|nr:unnamed protein product [Moneuplotes crassus]